MRGANFAAMARALVACGWFGIQTWIGGLALDALMTAAWGGWANVPGHSFITFFVFWAIQLVIILRGIEGVKWFESFSAPLLLVGSLALLLWGFIRGRRHSQRVRDLGQAAAGRRARSGRSSGRPWRRTWGIGSRSPSTSPTSPATRRPSAPRSSGRPSGLPLTMTAFSFIGIAVTAATIVVFDEAIWDPVVLVTQAHADIARCS